jgi:hypothetical protein
MRELLIQFLQKIKPNDTLTSLGETATKSGIIEPILRILGWDTTIFANEVTLEYVVEDGRIDYCLHSNKTNLVFLEAKRPSEDIEKHEGQLLGYAFHHGVKLAILSNGITWSFYLPLSEGDWQNRRFYTIDILEQDSSEAASRLIDFLSKSNVISGESTKNGEQLLASKRRQEIIDDTIPEAWNRIVSEPDSLLIEILADLTSKICGHKPSVGDVSMFFQHNYIKFLLSPLDEQPEEMNLHMLSEPKSKESHLRDNIPIPESDKMPVRDLIPEIILILRSHGGRTSKEQVEKEIFKKFEQLFSTPYYQQRVSWGIPRWQHNLAWAKENAKTRGYVKWPKDSGHGIWELTQTGFKNGI